MNNISRKGVEVKAIFALVLPSIFLWEGLATCFLSLRNIFN